MLTPFQQRLQFLKDTNNLRSVANEETQKLSFISNDYLGLAEEKNLHLKFWEEVRPQLLPMGSTGSRLLSGNICQAKALELLLAEKYKTEAALLFNSGYHANVGILSSLKGLPNALIIADKLCHASIIDGLLLSGLPFMRFRHNSVEHLEQLIQKAITQGIKTIVVVVESIYSMDGDLANLYGLCELKKRYPQVMLYVDEAHAIGVRGKTGLGLAEETKTLPQIDFLVGTFGKAFCSMGAFVVAKEDLISYFINTARSFIFSTMLPPIVVEWNMFILQYMPLFSSKREHLLKLGSILRKGLRQKGYTKLGDSHIIPLYCPGNDNSKILANNINQHGFEVRAIHVPTVPAGSERIRLSLSAAMPEQYIHQFLQVVPKATE